VHDVVLPKLGMGTLEADIVERYVGVGEFVPIGGLLVEVETEKVTTDIEADAAGVLAEWCVAEGDVAAVGSVICRIDTTREPPS
jgi:pyruvate/2-oxoglutarate dehydrogenase complex dihydrolipoamide acyltransferase (E2) component